MITNHSCSVLRIRGYSIGSPCVDSLDALQVERGKLL
jgi:hypothetical protein